MKKEDCCGCHEHHDHEHHHGHHHHEEGSIAGRVAWLAATAALLVAAMVVEHTQDWEMWQLLLLYIVPYLMVGHETLHEAAEGVMHGDAFNEHFLMSIATLGALAIGFMPDAEPEMAEAVFVMLFFQVGEMFEGYAEGSSRRSIAHLMNIRPDVAHVERGGKVEDVNPQTVGVGETIVIRAGERVPLDGVVVEGQTSLDTVALTGESVPRTAAVDDEVVSGCVNLTGVVRVRTTKNYGQSTVAKIIELVENAGENKSRSETFIARFARIYTPIVVFAAVALAVVPTLFSGEFSVWLHRALIFLVVSCPCALVLSVPLTFFGGIGGASCQGILIKGSSFIDVLAQVRKVVFDKTGTLTRGEFAVTAVHPDRCDVQHLLHLAAHVEHYSTHPIAAALRAAYPNEDSDGCHTTDVEEIAGHGVRARVEGHLVCVGTERMMALAGAEVTECHEHHDEGSVIHVAIDGQYAGHIIVGDTLKPDAADAIERLHALGVERTVMLTGDRRETAAAVAAKVGVGEFHAELLPADKVAHVERLLGEGDGSLAFVGDGINDAPVLARADVGIAMGALGSDAAIEAADVVLMDDQPTKIATAISIARRTLGIARQNVVFAIGVKIAVLLLAAFGLATMWMAAFADVGVTALAVLNAMRAMQKG